MPRKKKTNGDQPIGIGLTTKQMNVRTDWEYLPS